MTTKEQERKALEQIRKIVAGLGEDSYIGTAFEGCFEIAEENIENDWACSMKGRMESEARMADCQREQVAELKAEVSKLKKDLEAIKQERDDAQQEAKQAGSDFLQYKEMWLNVNDEADNNLHLYIEANCRVVELEQEVIKLKAKLYDFMTA